MSDYLLSNLTDKTFDMDEETIIKNKIEDIQRYGRDKNKTGKIEEDHDYLMIEVVKWCQKHPALISREISQNLKR
jgi:hypothetical protein